MATSSGWSAKLHVIHVIFRFSRGTWEAVSFGRRTGGRLFFLNMVSDNGADNIYVVDLRSGLRKLFLEKTTITILGWR